MYDPSEIEDVEVLDEEVNYEGSDFEEETVVRGEVEGDPLYDDPESVVTSTEVVELSAEEHQALAEECYDLESKIKENIATGREAMWDLARNLYEFEERKGWAALGYETQQDWLAQPEIGMTRTNYFRLVRRYQELVVYRQLPESKLLELEPSKIDIVLPTIEKGSSKIDEILEDAKSLGARDLREKYIGKKARERRQTEEDKVLKAPSPRRIQQRIAETADEKPPEEAVEEEEKTLGKAHGSAAVVDSWILLGGDRRKARRHWDLFREVHPLFGALERIGNYVHQEGEMPDKATARADWKYLCEVLQLSFDEE